MLKSRHKAFLIDGFLFADFRYTIGHKIVCFPGCFPFVVVIVVAVIDTAVAAFVVAVGAAAVVVAAADIDGE